MWWMHNYKSTVVYIIQFMGKISLQMSILCHLKWREQDNRIVHTQTLTFLESAEG